MAGYFSWRAASAGSSRFSLLSQVAQRIHRQAPTLKGEEVPPGAALEEEREEER